jgi:hypothetical protein
MPTPEIPIDTQVKERPETFSESITQTGAQPTPANVKPVVNDQGQPLISTPATVSAKIQLPADPQTLLVWSKGSITNAVTWLGKFFLRLIAKQNASNTD